MMTVSTRWSDKSLTSSENGSFTVALVLLLPMLMVLLGLVIDGGAAFVAHQAAAVEAEQAARAGAGAVDVGFLRLGIVRVDPTQAVAAAERFTQAAGHPGSASLAAGLVTVHVSYAVPTTILGMVGIAWLHVSASSSARNLRGVTVGQS